MIKQEIIEYKRSFHKSLGYIDCFNLNNILILPILSQFEFALRQTYNIQLLCIAKNLLLQADSGRYCMKGGQVSGKKKQKDIERTSKLNQEKEARHDGR